MRRDLPCNAGGVADIGRCSNKDIEVGEVLELIHYRCACETPARDGLDGDKLSEGLANMVARLVRLIHDKTVPGAAMRG